MNKLIQNPRALRRIAEDRIRMLAADHGGKLVSALRRVAKLGPRDRYLGLLMLEHRMTADPSLVPLVKRNLPHIFDALPRLVEPTAVHFDMELKGFRAIVLRPPSWAGERMRRGVLLIKFTETFRFFYHRVDIAQLMRYFHVVLEPSWSGYCLPEILLWARFPDPIIVQASEALDRDFLSELSTNLVPIEIGASDWVDHRVFRPLDVPKEFDVIYVANLTPMKRVNVYLRAVSEIVRARPGFRAALVVSSFGGSKQEFEQLLRWYGIGPQLTVLMNQTQAQLNDIVNRSRVSVLLSRKEGSNKTLFESMFAGTPVILIDNNIGVNKQYVNEHTGCLAGESELASAILRFSEGGISLRPRDWAIANISPERSTAKLAAKLREVGADEPGDGDLLVKANTPEATYMDPAATSRMPEIVTVMRNFAVGSHIRGDALDGRLRALFTSSL